MAIIIPPTDFNRPVPNSPFYSPETMTVAAGLGTLVIGNGLEVDYAAGILQTSGGGGIVTSLTAGTGISLSAPTGAVTITNSGVTSLVAGSGISVSAATGSVVISSSGGTVTSISTGPGLTGGPITTSGTISLDSSGVIAGSYAYPDITVDSYGRVTNIVDGVPPVTSVNATAPVIVSGSVTTPTIGISAASTSAPGAVQLNDTTTSTSVTQALTAAQGKVLQDQIDALALASNLTFAGTIDASTGTLLTVTSQGSSAGFSIGAPLPAPSASIADFFVLVTVQGTMIPPGGAAQLCHQGDWWLCNGSVWEFLDVGYNVAYASTTTPGVIQIATDAEVQAGTENSYAVVSSSLQSKISDSISTTSSTTIASSTAVKTAYDLADSAQTDANNAQTDATQALNDAALAQADATQALADAAAAQADASQALTDAALAQADATQALSDAATAQAVADAALPKSGGTMTGNIVFAPTQLFPTSGIPDGTLTQKGLVQLQDSVTSVSTTTAATPSSVKVAYDTASNATASAVQALSDAAAAQATADAALPKAGGAMSGNIVFSAGQTFPVSGIQDGTTSQKGVVQLEDSVASTSTTTAATPNSVRQVNSAAVNAQTDATQALLDAAAAQTDATQALANAATAQATADAALPLTGGTMTGDITFSGTQTFPASSIQDGTLTQKGVVQLNNSVSSTSDSEAATPSAVKQSYDAAVAAQAAANAALPKAGGTMSGDITFAGTQTFPITGIQDGTTSQKGVVQLEDSTSSTSTTTAATPNSVKSAYDAAVSAQATADAAIPSSTVTAKGDLIAGTGSATFTALPVGADGTVLSANSACSAGVEWIANPPDGVQNLAGTSPITVDSTDPTYPVVGIDAASISQPGAVQLNDTVTSTSTSQAATANAAKVAYDAGVQGQTDAAAAQATADAALPKTGGTMTGDIVFSGTQTFPASSIQDGTLTQKGVVQLNNSTTSTSDTEAATPSAVKAAYDSASAAQVDATQALSDAAAAQADATQALSDAAAAQATADAALPKAGGTMTGDIVFTSTQTIPADQVTYDNTTSGLPVTDVQEAIDLFASIPNPISFYSSLKAVSLGSPIQLLQWGSGVRMGTLYVWTLDNDQDLAWANITIAGSPNSEKSAVTTQSTGFGTFSVVSGPGGETIVEFTATSSTDTVPFTFQYIKAVGGQPTVL